MKARYVLLLFVLASSGNLPAQDLLNSPGPGYRTMASPAGLPDSVDRMPVIGDRTGEVLKRLKELEDSVSKMEKIEKGATATETPRRAEDPGDVFVNAYMKVQRAEKAVLEKDFDSAAALFKEADQLLAGIQEKYPSWQPTIVRYRRDRVAKSLADLQKEGKIEEKPEVTSKMERSDKKATGAERPQGAGDPGDVFVDAYMKCQRALKAAQEKDLDTAATLFKEADELLAGLQEKYPNWQAGVVKYRRDRVVKELADLQRENKVGEKPEATRGEERKQ